MPVTSATVKQSIKTNRWEERGEKGERREEREEREKREERERRERGERGEGRGERGEMWLVLGGARFAFVKGYVQHTQSCSHRAAELTPQS